MSIHIGNLKGNNIDITPAIRSYVEKKIAKLHKLVDKDDSSAMADIELGKEVPNQHSGNIFYAQINLHVRGEYFSAKAEKDDLYAAIDEVQDEMERELRKSKGKKEALTRRGARKIKEMIKGIRDFRSR